MKLRGPRPIQHVVIRAPALEPSPADGWIADTYRLLDGFECDRRRKRGRELEPMGAFVIAASDYLWERYGSEASWHRFELEGLFALFQPFLLLGGWGEQCVAGLREFFAYLHSARVIDAISAARIARELDIAASTNKRGHPT